MTQGKLRAASALQAAQEERDQLAERVQLQARQLQEEQAQTDSLAAERDSLQGGANRHRIRVSPTASVTGCCFRTNAVVTMHQAHEEGIRGVQKPCAAPSMPHTGLWPHQKANRLAGQALVGTDPTQSAAAPSSPCGPQAHCCTGQLNHPPARLVQACRCAYHHPEMFKKEAVHLTVEAWKKGCHAQPVRCSQIFCSPLSRRLRWSLCRPADRQQEGALQEALRTCPIWAAAATHTPGPFQQPKAHAVQASVLEGEKEVLQEAAEAAQARLREARESMAAQIKELSQLQHLPPRLQDMQDQVGSMGVSRGCLQRPSLCLEGIDWQSQLGHPGYCEADCSSCTELEGHAEPGRVWGFERPPATSRFVHGGHVIGNSSWAINDVMRPIAALVSGLHGRNRMAFSITASDPTLMRGVSNIKSLQTPSNCG